MDRNINSKLPPRKKEALSSDTSTWMKGILNQDISIISQVITLIENKPVFYSPSLIQFLSKLPNSPSSLRIAVTGAPGAGKSTFIEAIGLALIEDGYSVAVIAIDPASERSRGSILGDKTRMEKLSKSEAAYIRPSSNALEAGGVRSSTYQTIRICESAGFDFIFVETVGVGQSEIEVEKMTDLFLLLLSPSGGDELQGIKRGIVEMADLLLINKSDGGHLTSAERTKSEYKNAIHMSKLQDKLLDEVEVLNISSLEGLGIEELKIKLEAVRVEKKIRKKIAQQRISQNKNWLKKQAQEMLHFKLSQNNKIASTIEEIRNADDAYQALINFSAEIDEKLKSW